MTAARHTPGPWEVRAGDVFQVGSGGPPLASYIGRGHGTPDHCAAAAEERRSNAALIAAAPDLFAALAACDSVLRAVENGEFGSRAKTEAFNSGDFQRAIVAAGDALKKAVRP